MKKHWKKWIIIAAVLAIIIAVREVYRAWEIATRPEPAVAWWELSPTTLAYYFDKIESLGLRFPSGPRSNLYVSTLYASNEDGTKIWIVKRGNPEKYSEKTYASPGWACISGGALPVIEYDLSDDAGTTYTIDHLVDLRTGRSTAYSPRIAPHQHIANNSGSLNIPNYLSRSYSKASGFYQPLYDNENYFSSSLAGFLHANDFSTTSAVPSGLEFVHANGFSNRAFAGSDGLLVATSNTEYTGYSQIPKASPTARIGFFDMEKGEAISLYEIGGALKDFKFIPVAIPITAGHSGDKPVLVDTKVRLKCILPKDQNGDALVLISIKIRKGNSQSDNILLATISPREGITAMYDFPPEIVQSFQVANQLLSLSSIKYIPKTESGYLTLLGAASAENGYVRNTLVFRWTEERLFEKVYELKSNFYANEVFTKKDVIWFSEVDESKDKQLVTYIKAFDLRSGELKTVRKTHAQVFSMHTLYPD